MAYELPLRYRGGRHRDEKRRIAVAAVTRVDDQVATVGLTGGTTTTEVARGLVDRQGLTVVTNALNIAAELALRPNLRLVVTGGTARSESYELVGPQAEAVLSDMNLDIAFVGVDGISAAGRPDDLPRRRGAHQPGADRARARVVVVADGSKVGRLAFARICDLADVHELITDIGGDRDELARIEDAGVTVTRV